MGQWDSVAAVRCPLTAVRRGLGCIPERDKRGAADAAGCVEGLCSLALRGRKFGCPLSAGCWTVFLIRKGASRGGHLTVLGDICQNFKEHVKEALIKSLSDFILVFLFNARNQSTRIASYLRRLMTQHWIKVHMKFDSAN